MSGLRVIVSPTPKSDIVALSVAEGSSLRKIERSLRQVGVDVVRNFEQLYFAVAELPKVRSALMDCQIDVSATVQTVVDDLCRQENLLQRSKQVVASADDLGVVEQWLSDFPEKSKLDPHQVTAVAVATHPDVTGLCLFDEQGLGKTVTTLFSFHRLYRSSAIDCMLVVSPKNMVLEWVNDSARFFPGKYQIQPVLGTEREKAASLSQSADIYVTNFETVSRLPDQLRQLVKAHQGRVLLVIDESFFVKSATARRTKAVRELRRLVQRCIVLCGTPAPNSPHDLVEQFNIADGGLAFAGVRVPDDRQEARAVVQQVIEERGVYLRRLKQDVMPGLPEKTFHQVLVPLQPEQSKVYTAVLLELIHDLKRADDITFKKHLTSFMARRSALLQVCSNPAAVVEGYAETPGKVLALDSILEELIVQRGEKVVLWSFYRSSLEALTLRYQQYNAVRFDGSITDATARREAVRRFQEDNETMLFIANPAAAGAGLTLHRACFAVYESWSNQAAHYLQSLDRIHRRGQTRNAEYIILVSDQTIEVKEYDRLLEKEKAAQELLGDQVEPSLTRLTMLDEFTEAARLLGLDSV